MIWKLCVVLAAIAAFSMPSTAAAARTLDVHPHQVKFGRQTFETRTFSVTNTTRAHGDADLRRGPGRLARSRR
jgi:hypothetical protein